MHRNASTPLQTALLDHLIGKIWCLVTNATTRQHCMLQVRTLPPILFRLKSGSFPLSCFFTLTRACKIDGYHITTKGGIQRLANT